MIAADRAAALDRAAQRAGDVIVLGAGPAGTATAIELTRRSAGVLLVEREHMPRVKVCGCCLGAAAITVLEQMRLGDRLGALGACPLDHLHLHAGATKARLPIPRGAAVSRRALDAALVDQAIGAGATLLDGCTADVGPMRGPVREVMARRDGRSETLSARLVIDACGLRRPGGDRVADAPPRRDAYVGVAANLEPMDGVGAVPSGAITMACGRGGYAGTVRLETGHVRVAAALSPVAVRCAGGPGPAVASILQACKLPWSDPAVAASWQGTARLMRRPKRVAAARLLMAGDAAGYVEPFTGEGIAWALASGRAVAPIAAAAIRSGCWHAQWEHAWIAAHERLLADRHRRCHFVARSLRHPRLVRASVALAGRAPLLARPLLRRIGSAPSVTGEV